MAKPPSIPSYEREVRERFFTPETQQTARGIMGQAERLQARTATQKTAAQNFISRNQVTKPVAPSPAPGWFKNLLTSQARKQDDASKRQQDLKNHQQAEAARKAEVEKKHERVTALDLRAERIKTYRENSLKRLEHQQENGLKLTSRHSPERQQARQGFEARRNSPKKSAYSPDHAAESRQIFNRAPEVRQSFNPTAQRKH